MNDINSKDQERYHDLFKKLDVNSDGKIDVNDLVALFEQNKVSDCQQSHLVRAQVGSRCVKIPTDLVAVLYTAVVPRLPESVRRLYRDELVPHAYSVHCCTVQVQ